MPLGPKQSIQGVNAMNLIRCEFPSDALHTYVRVMVLLPKKMKTPLEEWKPKDVYPVLYLLHGALDYGDNWLYRTELADLVDEKEIAVVLPSVGNSFYLDEPEGLHYFTFLTEELPDYLGRILPLSKKREESFLGGLSMGGYGSLYATLRNPERYGKVFSLSGAVDIRHVASFTSQCGAGLPSHLRDWRSLLGGEYDLLALLERADTASMPPVFLACGTEDFFLQDNQALAEAMKQRGINVEFHAVPGEHAWKFWRTWLNCAFDFLV